MYEIIKQLLITAFQISEIDINRETDLEEDLGMDEINKMQLYVTFEEELGLEINMDEFSKLHTVNEIVKCLEKEDYERS